MKLGRATSIVSRKLASLRATPVARSISSSAAVRQNAGHILPASGEAYTAPLGAGFNMNKSKMFCNQCSQHNKDCGVSIGNCRKTPDVAKMQDEIVQLVTEIGYYAHEARKAGKTVSDRVNEFTLFSMFSTLTNVNNDPTRFPGYLQEALKLIKDLKALAGNVPTPDIPPAAIMGQRKLASDPNAASLCEMLVYGLKGVAAYADHAHVFGKKDPRIFAFIHEAFAFLASPDRNDLGKCLAMCLRCGEANLWTMELLYEANATLGKPEPTEVRVTPVPGKAVLVSGHDLHVMESLLQACEPLGIKVYTHGEMLPGHAYPKLKQYKSLAGHFGGAWNRQAHEFAHFPGPIVLTSNCLTEPQKSYKDHVYTFGAVGWPNIKHLGDTAAKIDWAPVMAQAQSFKGFSASDTKFSFDVTSPLGQASPAKPLIVGFGHDTVLGAAGTVIKGIEAGAIQRFFLIGGCDGDAATRNYYTDLSENLPSTSVLLTLGCGKYRISDKARERLGNIGDTGIPRVLDLGQCNDTFSAIKIAVALADALKCKVSDLPLSIVLSWYEQKAIAVLLTCLHLGLKPIRIGPVLPAFVTKDVLDVLVKNFGILPVGDHAEDLKVMTASKSMS